MGDRLLSGDKGVAHAEPAEIQLGFSPFPEDGAPVERPFAPFQPSVASHSRTRREGGPATGVRSTSNFGEIALVPTLLAAMPFQPLRRYALGRTDSHPLLVRSDWKARRRAPQPENLLVLVLDPTACGQSDWPVPLIPFIREAYVRRSAVCIVLVGALGAPHELRAERILVHNIVASAVAAALDRRPGRATPLASGLHLAFEAIRDARHRGRRSVLQATLVVLSDGRGNVPFEASRTGRLSAMVATEGIEDALREAARLGALDRVDKVLLDPRPPHASHLVEQLAEALQARIIPVPRREAAQAEEDF
jgi:magnesium chelatase subunit D